MSLCWTTAVRRLLCEFIKRNRKQSSSLCSCLANKAEAEEEEIVKIGSFTDTLTSGWEF